MKKLIVILGCLALVLSFSNSILAKSKKGEECTTIQSGELYGSDGSLIETGYNEWGYNYQARTYNGMYCDYHPYYRPGGAGHDWCQANYGDVELIMKWNDAWLSNKDCDDDGKLDRWYGFDSYIGSGAWTTNHMSGGEGKDHWVYFTKIVAVPEDAYLGNPNFDEKGGYWYAADGTEIGEVIWGSFAIIMEVESGLGATYVSPVGPGFGKFK